MEKDLVIGIDIGGTNTVIGIVDRNGSCLYENCIKTASYQGAEAYVEALAKEILKLEKKTDQGSKIIGIGVGAPNGNFFTGSIEFAPNLNWKGIVPLASMIGQKINHPVVLTNDANAAAIGEMVFGSAKGMKDFIVITLGTGVGSGIVVNGKLVYGHDGFAGEIGHTTVDPEGRICGCGKKGCLETYCSSKGIVTTVIEILKNTEKQSILRKYSNTELNSLHIYEAAREKDAVAIEAFEFTGKILGMKLADAVAHTSPEAIILFGGLSLAGDYIFDPVKKYMDYFLLPIWKNKIKLLPSKLVDNNPAVLGAAALAFKQFA
jgi:glucokinase